MIYEYKKVRAKLDKLDTLIRDPILHNRADYLKIIADLYSAVDEKYYREKQEDETDN